MRNLNDTFINALKEGHLKPLLERVQAEPNLELFIRGGYINIYYKGASILKLSERSSRFLVEVASPYVAPVVAFAKYGVPPLPAELNKAAQVADFLQLLPLLKQGVLDSSHRGKRELEFEQLFTRINNRLGGSGVNSDYFVVDRQYAEIGKRESRPDLLGVRWNTGGRSRGDVVPPVLIEVKYGLNSDIQKVAGQVRQYVDQLQQPGKWSELVGEMQGMLTQRAELGLFGEKDSKVLGTLKIDECLEKAEILILMVDYNHLSDLYKRAEADLARLAADRGLNIRVAHVGMALWEANTSLVGSRTDVPLLGEIHLYRRTIMQQAERFRSDGFSSAQPLELLCAAMVLRHEMVHAACHLGRSSDLRRWPFELMTSKEHETLAELLKDEGWEDACSQAWALDAALMAPWYAAWHQSQEANLPPGDPYRQHLQLRQPKEEGVRQAIREIVTRRIIPGPRPEASTQQSGAFDPELLKKMLDPGTTGSIPEGGIELGSLILAGHPLLRLLGLDGGAAPSVRVRLYEEKPAWVTTWLDEPRVAFTYGNLESLRQAIASEENLSGIDDPHAVTAAVGVILKHEDMRVADWIQREPFPLADLENFGSLAAEILAIPLEQLREEMKSACSGMEGEYPPLWPSTMEAWRTGSNSQRKVVGWVRELQDMVRRIQTLMEEYGEDLSLERQPSRSTLGVYTTKSNGEGERRGRSSAFKSELYAHLAAVKAREITPLPGTDKDGALHPHILPLGIRDQLPHIYGPIRGLVGELSFKRHEYFHHMVSSQAACLNLFLPILTHPTAEEVLRAALPDIQRIDDKWLGRGFAFEYSGEELGLPGGPIGDKSTIAGTDCDLAVAYLDKHGNRCLWMVEHKLTEQEFSTCGGYRSRGRDETRHRCDSSFGELLAEPHKCYYHDAKKYRYWEVVDANKSSFKGTSAWAGCPFKGGMNQLWRNQLLAWAIKANSEFARVTFSVVHHPQNTDVLPTIHEFQSLMDPSTGFFAFDSTRLIDAAGRTNDGDLLAWADWYRERYLPSGSRP